MEQVKYLLIGGGITNLALAQQLKSRDLLIVEGLDDVGGYCQTIQQDGFVWDYSGHFFHFRNAEIEQQLVSRIGKDKVRKVRKDSRIWFDGEWIDFPFQKNIHQLPKEDFVDCLVGLFEKDASATPQNFKEMLYAKFGKGISERFLVPYNEKLYATDLGELDVDAMGRFFPYADVKDIILHFRNSDNSSYNSTFTYPEGGAIQYVRAIQQDVPDECIALGERVLSLDLARKVATTTKREIRFEVAVNTAPFPKLLQMVGQEPDPAIYSYNKVLVFNLGFDKKGPEGVHWMYFPQKDISFYRIGFYDNIFDTPRLSMYVELGYPADAQLSPADIDAARQRVLEDLRQSKVIDDHQLVSFHQIVLDPAYVHITEASIKEVDRQKEILALHGVHTIGRYGSWTYCSIEDNILEARSLAERFNTAAAIAGGNA